MTIIYVGSCGKAEFYLHDNLLHTSSPFFNREFNNIGEASLMLPEIKPDIFHLVVHWLYGTGTTLDPPPPPPTSENTKNSNDNSNKTGAVNSLDTYFQLYAASKGLESEVPRTKSSISSMPSSATAASTFLLPQTARQCS